MQNITYRIVRSGRRTTAIQIEKDGQVVIRCPHHMPESRIWQIVKEKESWIRKKLEYQPVAAQTMTKQQLEELAVQAKRYIFSVVDYYAAVMGVDYRRITIRSQRTRWGSCSSKGNLNFNCLLMLAPEKVVDYVVVHELSHRIHMNHSAEFWKTVETYMPDYKMWRQWLKINGAALLAQLP